MCKGWVGKNFKVQGELPKNISITPPPSQTFFDGTVLINEVYLVDLTMAEMRVTMEQEKARMVEDFKKELQSEMKRVINETKKKQWVCLLVVCSQDILYWMLGVFY